MAEDRHPQPSTLPPDGERIPQSDPYPKMILVCIGISAVLFVLIFAVILFDFIGRTDSSVRPVRPPATAPAETPAR